MQISVFNNASFFVWNISANVGLHSPNIAEDVQLVQFGFFAASRKPNQEPELIPKFAAVRPGEVYSGGQNDPLTLAILAYERALLRPQDAHVSVIRGQNFLAAFGTFMMVQLDWDIRILMQADYPRLDKHPSCPPLLRAVVKRFFLP